MSEQIERRYSGGPYAAQKAFEADMAQAANQGWSVMGHKWDAGYLVVLYERGQRVTQPTASTDPAPWSKASGASSPAQGSAHSTPGFTQGPFAGNAENSQLVVGAGIAWIVAAALTGYLALEQLNALQTLQRFGLATGNYELDAAWNGLAAIITVYFGAILLMKRTGHLTASIIWAVVSVVGGVYQVANGVSDAAFLGSIVAAGAAGVLSLAARTAVPL